VFFFFFQCRLICIKRKKVQRKRNFVSVKLNLGRIVE